MRTTVRLDDALMDRVRNEAHQRGTTLTAFIQEGLRLVLRRPRKAPGREPISLPVCRAGGGLLPGINLNDTSSLLDRMEERR